MIVQEEYDLGTEASVTWLACKMQRKILSSVKKKQNKFLFSNSNLVEHTGSPTGR